MRSLAAFLKEHAAGKKDFFVYNDCLTNQKFKALDFSDCHFMVAGISRTTFEDCKMDRFGHVGDAVGAQFLRCSILDGGFALADLENSSFRACDLSGCLFRLTGLEGAHIIGCTVRGVKFDRVRFSNSVWAQTILDSVSFDSIGVLLESRALQSVQWTRVHVGLHDFDPGHDPSDEAYWIVRRGSETLRESAIRFLAETSNALVVEFRDSVWGQIFPLEQAILAILGEDFTIEKHVDRVIVRLKRLDQIQQLLDAAIPALAALHSELPGQVAALTINVPPDGYVRSEGADLRQKLDYVVARFDSEFPLERARLGFASESSVEALKGIPFAGDLLSHWLRRFLEAWPLRGNDRSINIFGSIRRFVSGARGVAELGTATRQIEDGESDNDLSSRGEETGPENDR